MGRFEERLWRELVNEQGTRLSGIARPDRRRLRPRLLAGTTAGLAGAGAAAALMLGAASTSPAFAVTRNHDGTVSVALRAASAIPAVNARLSQMGIPARLARVPSGCSRATPTPAMLHALAAARAVVRANHPGRLDLHARFDPRRIPAGKLLMISPGRAPRAPGAVPVPVPLMSVVACLPALPPSCGRAFLAPGMRGRASVPPALAVPGRRRNG
jgi:hypothetical protein